MSEFDISLFAKKTILEELIKLCETNAIKAVIWDMDGCTYDAERLSHFASTAVLAKTNPSKAHEITALKDELSDNLVGVQVTNQEKIIKEFFANKGLDLFYHEDFGTMRDITQNEMFKTLEAIPGCKEVLDELLSRGILIAAASRSRLKPMVDKIEVTGLNKYFTVENSFSSKDPLVEMEINELTNQFAINNNFDTSLLEYDKTRIFMYAAIKLGVLPSQCVGIEDTSKGVNSIIYAGMTPICFTGAPSTNKQAVIEDLADNPAEYIICDKML